MTIYTTGQVARICNVSPRQAGKWFDSGKLTGYRIPHSMDRRIPKDNLIKFIEQQGMPMPDELVDSTERESGDEGIQDG